MSAQEDDNELFDLVSGVGSAINASKSEALPDEVREVMGDVAEGLASRLPRPNEGT